MSTPVFLYVFLFLLFQWIYPGFSQSQQQHYSKTSVKGSYRHQSSSSSSSKFIKSTAYCEKPAAPIHGFLTCQMYTEDDKYICTARCDYGYHFPDDAEAVVSECRISNGLWYPHRRFPDCVGTGGGGSSYDSSYQQQSQQRHISDSSYGRYQKQSSPDNCPELGRPMNARVACQIYDTYRICQQTCMPGNVLPDGTTHSTLTCHFSNGWWEPGSDFQSCQALCHPPCENGATCVSDNQCMCARGFRGNRCQYSYNLCDTSQFENKVVYRCHHGPEYTECHISCPSGMSLNPPTPPLFRCTVDGHWNPPIEPHCVAENLCNIPPSPMNGYVQCNSNNDVLLCTATCRQGFLFPDGFSELISQCTFWNGEWTPSGSFPDCEPICSPECRNGGHCVGHNRCLCTEGYAGDRCQYSWSDCNIDVQLASVDRSCNFGNEEVVCTVSCNSNGGRLDPPQTSMYRCTPDGRWFPDQRPTCRVSGHLTQMQNDYHERENQQLNSREYAGQQAVDYDFEEQSRYKSYEQQTIEKNFNKGKSHSVSQSSSSAFRENEVQEYQDLDGEEYKQTNGDQSETDYLEESANTADLMGTGITESSSFRGVCSAWGVHNYRTFDGGTYIFPGTCTYLMASVCNQSDVSIRVHYKCKDPGSATCLREIEILIRGDKYVLSPIEGLSLNDDPLEIPISQSILTVERISRYIVARMTTVGFSVWMDDLGNVHITARPHLRAKTCGLCGNFDGTIKTESFRPGSRLPFHAVTFGNSWRVQDADDVCVDASESQQPVCKRDTKAHSLISTVSNARCLPILDMQFNECFQLVEEHRYFRLCQTDCCLLQAVENCECSSLAEYFLECARAGGDISAGWRQEALCPMHCTNGTTYQECGPACPPTCDNLEPVCPHDRCVDGCHCPPETVLNDGQCIPQKECPCHYGDKLFSSGETIERDCNTCLCEGGHWSCTEEICPATCTISGPHFKTFDGLDYDAYIHCSYYLVDHDRFSIVADYGANCRESESLLPTCVRSITIHTPESAIVKLKPGMEVSVNGQEMRSLPLMAPGVYVGQATSVFLKAQLSNGLEVLWDGGQRIYIYAPVNLHDQLRGLCGTYTNNQNDDYLTPEGDTELTSTSFIGKWRKFEVPCSHEYSLRPQDKRACEKFSEQEDPATEICGILKDTYFAECHDVESYERYYRDCMEDVCNCPTEPIYCSCSALSNYAAACARKGRPLLWRVQVPECGIHCPIGQVYETCATSCSYSCAHIAQSPENCRDSCVEGCVCPPGTTLSDNEGECIPVSSCSCIHSGHLYPPSFMQKRGSNMCECSEGQWDCRKATADELAYTSQPYVDVHCSSDDHKVSTDCLSECPVTCTNFHHHEPCTVAVCEPGCRCEDGYVLDTQSDTCVLPQECPCHHGGKSYEEGAEMKIDCNNCVCTGGTWHCDQNLCPGTCSAWGDSHYRTFDGRTFDFQGECDYIMVRGRVSDGVTILIVIQNMLCGTSGATCSKAVTVTLGDSSVTLTREQPLPTTTSGSRLTVSQLGLFTLVNSDVGISLQWDRKTRVYVTAQPVWLNKLQGLCGDFDSDSVNDFRPPSGGIPLVAPEAFANSWRVHHYCRQVKPVEDACIERPERRSWARDKCSVLMSDLFQPCHSRVEVEEYYRRCQFDACACDSGGDCECFCAAVAAYAQECTRHDVLIQWRSQDLCPIQCEACDEYSPCISMCPPRDCDNFKDLRTHACSKEPCVEGCSPKHCPVGQVYVSAVNLTCVPEEMCEELPCITIDGIDYGEGERIESKSYGDACQSCYCRHGEIDCVGLPCTPEPTILVVSTPEPEACDFTGWTEWINSFDPEDYQGNDEEILGQLVSSHRIPCPLKHIESIQCRVASTQAPFETTGQKVRCDTQRGLVCISTEYESCLDYEIKVYCNCEKKVCPPGEEWDDCAFHCDSMCDSLHKDLARQGHCQSDEQCIPGCSKDTCRPPFFSRDSDTCVLSNLCTCKLDNGFLIAPGEVVTNGCEKCQCLNNSLICSTIHECRPITTAPPIFEPTLPPEITIPGLPPSISVSQLVCKDGWSSWINLHKPDYLGESESLSLMSELGYLHCSIHDITEIECRDEAREIFYDELPQKNIRCDVSADGLLCHNSEQAKGLWCPDFEIRVYCDCKPHTTVPTVPVVVTTKPITGLPQFKPETETASSYVTPPEISCTHGWTPWKSLSRPNKIGEFEYLSDLKEFGHLTCTLDQVTDVECRDVLKRLSYKDSPLNAVTCNITGYQCENRKQGKGRWCSDYEIRAFCNCEPQVVTTKHITEKLTPKPITPFPGGMSFGFTVTPAACSFWSDWINKNRPKAGRRYGEKELTLPYILKQTEGFCLQGQITEIECRDAESDTDYSLAEQEKLICNLKKGFICKNRYQPNGQCRDYKIRYFCSCEKKEELTTIFVKTTTPTPVYPCTNFVPLIDGYQPLPDSRFRASSSRSPLCGPQAARMSSISQGFDGGAWTAGVENSDQYIEVDLGKIYALYGINIEGKDGAPEWVTSFRILYSRDGVTFSYYTEDDSSYKVFSGCYDSSSLVRYMFEQPFEARYVRVQPLTWEGKISLRFDLLGCAEAVEMPVPTTFVIERKPFIPPEIYCKEPMGLKERLISDFQLSASSAYDTILTPAQGKLGSENTWSAASHDNKPYLQVDFITPQNISGVITKGREKVSQWVTAYKVLYSNDGETWNPVTDENGNVKEFSGNFDEDTEVTNLFPTMIRARFIRVAPTKWKNWASMQIEVLGCYHAYPCLKPMGLESKVIADYQLSASSNYEALGVEHGRIDSIYSWSSAVVDKNQYFQVDLLEPMLVTAVVTKGRHNAGQWVTAYEVSYSSDGLKWKKVENELGNVKEFPGNEDKDSAVINLLPIEVQARFIRIHPLRWKYWISMRVELLGCFEKQECKEPMGLENGLLPDSQITASSSYSGLLPTSARLSSPYSWSAKVNDLNQYLMVDFVKPQIISAVVTKGRGNYPQWVKKYKVLTSLDDVSWDFVTDGSGLPKVFPGNDDNLSPVINFFASPVLTRFVKIIPLEWKDWISMRVELLGCYHPYPCEEPMGMENGNISNYQITASSFYSDVLKPSKARINSDTSWSAEASDIKPFVMVDFIELRNLTGIITQGRKDQNQWVTLYRVAYSSDGENWQFLMDGDTVKDFTANTNNDSPVTNLFPDSVLARYIKIMPTKWTNWMSLRFEVLGCFENYVCMEPMGLENGLLTDGLISASTFRDPSSSPAEARLNGEAAWSPRDLDKNQYVQVEFDNPTNVTAVVTKGNPANNQWVKSYQVAYSDDGENWNVVTDEAGNLKEFTANEDAKNPVINILPESIETNYIRLLPTDWNNWISLQLEILGCSEKEKEEEETVPPFTELPVFTRTEKERLFFTTVPTEEGKEAVLPYTQVPEVPEIAPSCPDPSEQISELLDEAIIKPSSMASNSNPSQLRLDAASEPGLGGAWIPTADDLHPFVEIVFPEERTLMAIKTKGREDAEQWVKSYRIIASKDNITWMPVFGPNGEEEIEANNDQHSEVGHYFRKPVAAKFVKLIPESWHQWPSFRMELLGCFHPKTTTILMPTTPTTTTIVTPIPKLLLCPEILPEMATSCPSYCPPGTLCDGIQCVDSLDCVCVHDDIMFRVSDKIEDKDCVQCDCALGGHSICTKKTCPPCEKGTKQVFNEKCECLCEECPSEEVMCPSSGECIPKKRWCDGIIDCLDDELHCIGTTEIPTTTTIVTTTTVAPLPANATCEIIGRHIRTFDGQEINYELCQHIALKDIEDESIHISIHKDCRFVKECTHWLKINIDDQEIKISDKLNVELDGHKYTSNQLVLLNKQQTKLKIEKVADKIVVKSFPKAIKIVYDIRGHLKIEVTPDLMYKIRGLCGYYSDNKKDDQQDPEGKLSYSSQEFGDSWAITKSAECVPTLCPHDVMSKAFTVCKQLKDEPFSNCSGVLQIENYIEFCMSSMCECLQKKDDTSNCKCDSFLPLVEACEEKLGPMSIKDWRLKHSCFPDCPPGMIWNDCGPSCQLTCDTPSFEDCSEECVAGCFCPIGTVLNGEICIPPDKCADRVCQGFGDPHLETFDGFFYPFQAVGTFLISADEDNKFVIKGMTKPCSLFDRITCIIGLIVTFGDHTVAMQRDKDLRVDGKKVLMSELPLRTGDMIVLGYPGRTFIVVVPSLNIEARFYEENSGFSVKLPSRRYFNKTVGLCGNCNAKANDEVTPETTGDFVCRWLTEGDKESCKKSFEELVRYITNIYNTVVHTINPAPEVTEPVDECMKLKDPIFSSCHPLVDPKKYINACSFDALHSNDVQSSVCKAMMEYGRQCCQAGLTIDEWPEKFGCKTGCVGSLEFHQCHSGCPQTCEARKNQSAIGIDCNEIKVDGCFCPEGQTYKNETCVNPILCDTCDPEGHLPGQTWEKGPCEKCHCSDDLKISCETTVCPEKPVCKKDEILTKQEREQETCCEAYTCIQAPRECPEISVPKCPKGHVAKVTTSEYLCPVFKCECNPVFCPPVVWPEDLEDGQVAELVNDSCCSRVTVFCFKESCPKPPDCDKGLELIEIHGECCTIYKCKPPKDICIYTHEFDVVEGVELLLYPDEQEPSTYKPGETWKDGLCLNCSCVKNRGQFTPQCTLEHCPSVDDLPESKDYVLHEHRIPGKCCPEIYRVNCKDEHGNIYYPDEEWESDDNPCIKFTCESRLIGDVLKIKKIIDCPECPRTSEFIPPSKRLGQCCGICRPAKCEDNDTLYEVDETWPLASNPCQTAKCVRERNTVSIVYTNPTCPDVPKDCPKDKIVKDEKGCCNICNVTSELKCNTAPLPLENTIGFFTFHDSWHGGVCVNEKPVHGVLQCSGACHSHSYYSLEDGDFKSVCMCCKVNITVNRTIELRCPDGALISKIFLEPATCQCSKCAPKPGRIKGKPESPKVEQRPSFDISSQGQEPEPFNEIFQERQKDFGPYQKQREGFQPVQQQQQNDFGSFQQEPQEPNFGSFQQEPQEPNFGSFQQEPQEPNFGSFQQEPQEPNFGSFQQEPEEPNFGSFEQEPQEPKFGSW